MSKWARRSSVLSLVALATSLNLLAADSLTKNSRINPNDTYVTLDESTVRRAQFDPSEASGIQRPASARETKLHVEQGYDSNGEVVLDITFVNSAPAYKTAVKEARFSAGKAEFFDGNGAPIQLKSGGAELAAALSAVSGISLTEGPAIQDIQAYAKAASATIVAGKPLTGEPASVTLEMPTRGSTGGTFRKTFVSSSQGWVLSRFAVTRPIADGSTSSETTFSNVLWHHNAANDAARKSRGTRPSLQTRRASSLSTIHHSRKSVQAPPPSSCLTTVTKLGGSQNVVFQHGLGGSSCSWTDSTYPMTTVLNGLLSFGTEIVPTLNWQDYLANQSAALVSQIQTTGGSHYILIGHSQGGLISRSAAQYFQTNSPSTVTGVITVDTPNQGAPVIVNSIGAGSKLGGYLSNILFDVNLTLLCEDDYGDLIPCDVGCSDPNGGAELCTLLAASGDNLINFAITVAGLYVLNSQWPATGDLEPGSTFLNTLNSYSENFVRVGIVSDSVDGIYPGPFLPEQMGGDLCCGASFGENTVLALQLVDLALNGEIAYLFSDEDANDCLDYPDQPVCWNDDTYINQYATIDNDIYVPDEYWDPLPLPNECCDFSDGIVNGQSQYYPPENSVAQYVIVPGDSHVGSTKSELVASVLYTALEKNFFVPVLGCTYTLSPTSATEGASGGKGTFTVTTASGCAWTVVSSASWITFSPASGSGSATISYTVAANTGSSRSGNLMVAGIATFSVTQSAGTSDTLTVTVTGNGTVKSSPAGISCPGTCSAAFPAGTVVNLTASATSGYMFTGWGSACSSSNPSTLCSVTMSGAESVTATFGAGFSLAASSGSQTVTLGGNSTNTVVISPVNGFTGTVALTASGLPSGLTASFNPSSVSINGAAVNSTLTLTASASMTAGTYSPTINGTNGSNSHSIAITAVVPIAIAVSPATATLASGKTQQYTATVTGTTTKTVTWGAQYGSLTSTGLYTAPATASPETDTVYSCSTVIPADCGTSTVSVTAAADFTIITYAVTNPEVLPQGGTAAFTVSIGAVDGFTGVVTLSAPGLPTGVTASFNPATITGSGNSTLTLSATSSAALATDTFTVKGTSGTLVNSASNSVQVVPGGVVVTLTPATDTLQPGQSVQLTAKVTGTTNTGLTWSQPAYGTLSPTYLYTAAAQNSIVLTDAVSACSVVNPISCGTTTITIPAGSGFFLQMPLKNSYIIPAGTSVSVGFYVYGGASGNITPSMKGLPTGVTASFNPTVLNSSNSYSSTLTLTASKSVAIGSFVPTLSATNGTSTATSGVPFTTETAPNITSVTPSSGPIGSTVALGGIPYYSYVCSPPCESQSDFYGDTVTVTFNGVATIFSGTFHSPGSVVVPTGLPAGNVSVVVTANGVSSKAATFNVTGPGVNTVSPAAAAQGTPVTLSGINFGSAQGTGQVFIGGCLAPVLSWNSQQITVLTPGVAENINGYVSGGVVVDTGGSASNTLQFSIEPSLSSISPAHAAVGSTVELLGSGLTETTGGGIRHIFFVLPAITFYNNVAATATTSATVTQCVQESVTTTVPTGATTGNVTAAIAGYTSNPVIFTIP